MELRIWEEVGGWNDHESGGESEIDAYDSGHDGHAQDYNYWPWERDGVYDEEKVFDEMSKRRIVKKEGEKKD